MKQESNYKKFRTYYVTADKGLLSLVQKTNGYLLREKCFSPMSFPNSTRFRHNNRL